MAMRLTLCEAPTPKKRPDHNTTTRKSDFEIEVTYLELRTNYLRGEAFTKFSEKRKNGCNYASTTPKQLENNSPLLVLSLPTSYAHRLSVTCHLVLKVTQ